MRRHCEQNAPTVAAVVKDFLGREKNFFLWFIVDSVIDSTSVKSPNDIHVGTLNYILT